VKSPIPPKTYPLSLAKVSVARMKSICGQQRQGRPELTVFSEESEVAHRCVMIRADAHRNMEHEAGGAT